MAKQPTTKPASGALSAPAPDGPVAGQPTATAAPNVATGGPAEVVKDDAALVSLGAEQTAGSLGEAAAVVGAPVVPVPAGGPGVGADRIAEAVPGTRSVALDPRTADPRGPTAEQLQRVASAPFGTAGALAAGGVVVDPDDIPGTRRLEAITTILRDGRSYAPGEPILLDFRGYEELVAIGAVSPIDWITGERIRITPTPGAARY